MAVTPYQMPNLAAFNRPIADPNSGRNLKALQNYAYGLLTDPMARAEFGTGLLQGATTDLVAAPVDIYSGAVDLAQAITPQNAPQNRFFMTNPFYMLSQSGDLAEQASSIAGSEALGESVFGNPIEGYQQYRDPARLIGGAAGAGELALGKASATVAPYLTKGINYLTDAMPKPQVATPDGLLMDAPQQTQTQPSMQSLLMEGDQPVSANIPPPEPFVPTEFGVTSSPENVHPKRISSRLGLKTVSGEDVISTEYGDPLSDQLQIGLEEAKLSPVSFEHNANIIKNYDNVTQAQQGLNASDLTEQFIDHVTDNLLYVFDKVPENTRLRSQRWYDGARNIANRFASNYGVDEASASGVLAALSPQKDWYMNVSLGERVMDTMANKKDFMFSNEMQVNIPPALSKPVYEPIINNIKNKSLGELTDPVEKAMWVRIYDETYNDRSHKIVSPEGDFLDIVKTQKGEPAKTGWGSLNEIAKAVIAFESKGDKEVLNRIMGNKHKVRSFYNNILDPNGAMGDVTIDTHAVAAGLLKPVSGNSTEVHHNFGSSPDTKKRGADWVGAVKNNKNSGVQGVYPLYAEAYRRAAKARGVLPRQMQSITWEAVRGLFTDGFKQNKGNVDAINKIWKQYRDGKINLDEARNAVIERAGGINPPSWQ